MFQTTKQINMMVFQTFWRDAIEYHGEFATKSWNLELRPQVELLRFKVLV